jgi:hypothetical protein
MTNILRYKTCRRCNKFLKVDSFYKDKRRKDGLKSWCKTCHWMSSNLSPNRQSLQVKYTRSTQAKRKRTQWLSVPENKIRIREFKKEHQRKLRLHVLEIYGNQCICCEETEPKFLTIDHVFGGGTKHRKLLGGGDKLYRALVKVGVPQKEFQLLCWNCNAAKGLYGECPHMTKRKALNDCR